MSLYIRIQLQELGSVKSISVHGYKGAGTYCLYLSMECISNLNQTAALSQLSCRLELGDNGPKLTTGTLEGPPMREWSQYRTEEQLGFFFYLTDAQISAIEKQRCAGDLKLGIWLSGVVEHNQMISAFSDKDTFTIPQQQWVQALKDMGYAEKFLYEIPLPKSNNDQLKELIQKAQEHILNGHYDVAVSQCRLMFEVFETADDYKKDAKAAANQFRDKRTVMTIAQRVMFAREAVKNITHMSAHFTGEDNFSRTQAISVLNLTLAVLAPEEGSIL